MLPNFRSASTGRPRLCFRRNLAVGGLRAVSTVNSPCTVELGSSSGMAFAEGFLELNVAIECAISSDGVKRVYGSPGGVYDGLFCCLIHTN